MTFQKGNKLAVANRGNNSQRRMTGRFISKEWYEALIDLDPQDQIPVIRKLVRKAIKLGQESNKLQDVLDLLKEGTDRTEGKAVQPLITAAVKDPRMITSDMTPGEAAKIYQDMLSGEDLEEYDDPPALPAPAGSYARRQRQELDDEDEEPKPTARPKKSIPRERLHISDAVIRKAGRR
jgi:hypothetical protein